jgi:hypothetical protein
LWYILGVWIEWAESDVAYIAGRSQRYPGALDLSVEWTRQAAEDERAVVVDPYSRSRVGAAAIVGYSAGAGRVLVVIAYRDLAGGWHGMNAWPATGLHLALYEKGADE